MNILQWALAAAAIVTLCPSCATQSGTIPSAADLDRNHQRFRALAQPQFDELEQKKASGALSQADYERAKDTLEYRVQQQTVDASWTAHSLAESDRKATGIPTPDHPQSITAGGVQGTLYQSHNDQYGGQAGGGFGAAGTMSSGLQQGGSILGSNGRRY